MASFAKIGANGEVLEVVSVHNTVITDSNGNEKEKLGVDFLNELFNWPLWKQTSYNTIAGKHFTADENGVPIESEDQSKAFRKNHASLGGRYDSDRDAFISKKPYASWILNETTCDWEAPVVKPDDGQKYLWNEETKQWDLNE
jgi:hypothetical protein